MVFVNWWNRAPVLWLLSLLRFCPRGCFSCLIEVGRRERERERDEIKDGNRRQSDSILKRYLHLRTDNPSAWESVQEAWGNHCTMILRPPAPQEGKPVTNKQRGETYRYLGNPKEEEPLSSSVKHDACLVVRRHDVIHVRRLRGTTTYDVCKMFRFFWPPPFALSRNLPY